MIAFVPFYRKVKNMGFNINTWSDPFSKPPPVAILGVTNTGKTRTALERILTLKSGMIASPLRLLAREAYGFFCERVGVDQAALITGEEKIIPPGARFFACTTEAAPSDLRTEGVIIDEAQLCADPERGHVFTDRILHLRGEKETYICGSLTLANLLKKVIPGVRIEVRDRLSELRFGGVRSYLKAEKRTAVVAFSVREVYAFADSLKRKRGGCAVVTGSLSPQTRNAQVEMYQNGDVDFIAATDAIGMGLNLDIDAVIFTQIHKFDGRNHRSLYAQEAAQIAGRAGRHTKDGVFYFDDRFTPDDPFFIEKIESNRFDDLRVMFWRNPDIDFSTPEKLILSLKKKPDSPFLRKAHNGEDMEAFQYLALDPQVRKRLQGAEGARLLWEIAQIPDYGKLHILEHVVFLKSIFLEYLRSNGRLSDDFIKKRIKACEIFSNDIEDLTKKIARIRTWTYISQKTDRVQNAQYWRERTRFLENQLSDALHKALKERFVNKKTSILLKGCMDDKEVTMRIEEDGSVKADGEIFGFVKGFKFYPDKPADEAEAEAAKQNLDALVIKELEKRVDLLIEEGDAALRIGEGFGIYYRGALFAKLKPTDDFLKPDLDLDIDDRLQGAYLARLALHLQSWLQRQIKPLSDLYEQLRNDPALSDVGRGFAFKLTDEFGYAPRKIFEADLKNLDSEERSKLRKNGVRFAQYGVFLRDIFKPAVQKIKLTLNALKKGESAPPPAPPGGLVSFFRDAECSDEYYRVAGYFLCDDLVVRADMIEKLADAIRPLAMKNESNPKGEFEVSSEMMSFVGKSGDELKKILNAMGYDCRSEMMTVTSYAPKTEAKNIEVNNIEAQPENTEPETPVITAAEATPDVASESVAEHQDHDVTEMKDAVLTVAPINATVEEDMTEVKTSEVTKIIWFWKPKFQKPHYDGAKKKHFAPRTDNRQTDKKPEGEANSAERPPRSFEKSANPRREQTDNGEKPRNENRARDGGNRNGGDRHRPAGERGAGDRKNSAFPGKKREESGRDQPRRFDKNRNEGGAPRRDRNVGEDGRLLSHVNVHKIEGDSNPFAALMKLKNQ